MAFSAQKQRRIWGIGFVILALVLWLLAGTLLPYIAGAAIAYVLDPLADRLERLGLGRVMATSVIAITVVVLAAGVFVLMLPVLIDQLQGLIVATPDAFNQATDFLARRFPEIFDESSPLRRYVASMSTVLGDGGATVLNQVLVSSLALLDFAVILLVTPVVAFYLLLDWDGIVAKMNGALPRRNAPVIRRLGREIDAVLAGFVRGQLSVCVILGTYYAVALMAIGLQFGFLVGFVAGMISFIPYVGSIIGLTLSMGIALYQFWGEPFWIFAVAGIFFFGQFVEGNILSPHLVGKSVGLHPVALLLALSVFGSLFGFAGMLIAVPVAAAMGVLARFGFEQYLASPLYSGELPVEDD